MEEELNCVAVTFKTNNTSTLEKADDLEIINDDVKTWDQTNPATPVNKQKAPLCTLLHVVAAGLGIVCVILALVVITLKIHFMSEQLRQNDNLTAQNLQLWTEKSDLERQMGELIRERDGLNWTVGVILEYEDFPVNSFCPKKVCKPCQDDWVHFQANCYLFVDEKWTWERSRYHCITDMKADLVVIESQEEQEFINNHINDYDDEKHGYWIGLRKTVTWTWVDRSKVTATYWKKQQAGYSRTCALSLPRAEPLANWYKARCDMWNRWICEKRALIKPD